MSWLMPAQQDFTLEREKESREYAKFLIRHVWHRMKQFLRFRKEELSIQRTDKAVKYMTMISESFISSPKKCKIRIE